jgi:hypothetical protein
MNNLAISRPKRTFGIFIFAIGILLSTLLAALLTWANYEAAFYGFQLLPGEHFDGLSCPPLMTRHETGTVRVQISNPSQKPIDPVVRIDVSTREVPDSREEKVVVAPGERRVLEQPVTAQNIDLGFFIFAKAFRYPAYPLSNADATCGIFILDVPLLTGAQLFNLWLGLALVLTPLGLWMWSSSLRPEGAGRMINAAKALAVIVMANLFLAVQAIWLLAILSLALSLLVFIAMLRFAIPK